MILNMENKMIQRVLDIVENAFPDYAFGRDKDGFLFVNGQKTIIRISDTISDIELTPELADSAAKMAADVIKKELLDNKLIKK